MKFDRYIGIDYSGAQSSGARLPGLKVYQCAGSGKPERVDTSVGDGTTAKVTRWNWSRKELAHWLAGELSGSDRLIVGIDHAFSFPESYFRRYDLSSWGTFLDDFQRHWPLDSEAEFVDTLRRNNPRTGGKDDLRLCEKWTSSAKSVFRLDGQGNVGKSSHCGIPWLRFLRRNPDLRENVHFWPFDGFDVPDGKSVLAEVYPSIFHRRFNIRADTVHDRDAAAVALWLQQMDRRGVLEGYFNPPLDTDERDLVSREGWILGIR